jgi:hypothetical protein
MKQSGGVSRRTLAGGALAVGLSVVGVAAASPASALDFRESWSGSVDVYGGQNTTDTFYWTNPHGNFQERFWVARDIWYLDNRYSIKMYTNAGTQVWSATNQGDRTYTIGGNVTKIVITTNTSNGVHLNWSRS